MTVKTVDLLAEIGRTVHGEYWQGALSRDLGINRQTILRWLTGRTPLPPTHGVWDDLADMLRERAAKMKSLAEKIEKTEQ